LALLNSITKIWAIIAAVIVLATDGFGRAFLLVAIVWGLWWLFSYPGGWLFAFLCGRFLPPEELRKLESPIAPTLPELPLPLALYFHSLGIGLFILSNLVILYILFT
jgi:hypothetical protein